MVVDKESQEAFRAQKPTETAVHTQSQVRYLIATKANPGDKLDLVGALRVGMSWQASFQVSMSA